MQNKNKLKNKFKASILLFFLIQIFFSFNHVTLAQSACATEVYTQVWQKGLFSSGETLDVSQGQIGTEYTYSVKYRPLDPCRNVTLFYKINLKDASGEAQITTGNVVFTGIGSSEGYGLKPLRYTPTKEGDIRACWWVVANQSDIKCGSYLKITANQEQTGPTFAERNAQANQRIQEALGRSGAGNNPLDASGGSAEKSIRDYLCTPSDASSDAGAASQDLYGCINRIYQFAIAFSAVAAVFMIVIAGYLYMASDGNEESVTKAKEILVSSITALIILFISFLLLREINPELVRFKTIQPPGLINAPGVQRLGGQYTSTISSGTPLVLKGCGREFRSAADAQIVQVNVNVWDISGGNKISKNSAVSVNQCIANKVRAAFQAIYNDPEKFPIKSLGGFNNRSARGSRVLSAHAAGLAIDINPAENPFIENSQIGNNSWKPCPGASCSPYSIPANGSVVRAFKAQGFGWGGEFNRVKDYMHVSCTENEHGNC